MTQQLSNCCKAQVSVSSGDEGTSCFMCDKCNKPCDLYPTEWSSEYQIEPLEPGGVLLNKGEYKIMKEQVSVDDKVIIGSLPFDAVLIPKEQYQRLKRLDENVKKLIAELKLVDGETTPSSLAKLLQGLYVNKEKISINEFRVSAEDIKYIRLAIKDSGDEKTLTDFDTMLEQYKEMINVVEENKRLKRLDENVKAKISRLKSSGIMTKWKRLEIELLEALYNENTQES